MLLLAALLAAPCNAHPAYAVEPKVSNVHIVRRSGAYVASAQLRFTLREVQPAVIPSVDPGLLDHVQGHMIVAQRVVRSSGGTVEANGPTAQKARLDLNQTVARMQRDLQSELDREERAYDNVTQNGAQQSQGPAYGFPGGPDAHTPCVH
jgi:hypothetical protein